MNNMTEPIYEHLRFLEMNLCVNPSLTKLSFDKNVPSKTYNIRIGKLKMECEHYPIEE